MSCIKADASRVRGVDLSLVVVLVWARRAGADGAVIGRNPATEEQVDDSARMRTQRCLEMLIVGL